ncbi:MAG TPA: NADH-quinone oxidoreductase subunit N [Chloroflexi bacterium]|nr:NADH-quinone oxidoreductase subunit N [Chloroflexota bacterium]
MFGEPTLTIGETLGLLAPELLLLITALSILGVEAFLPHDEERRWIPRATLTGLALALIATMALWNNTAPVLAVLSCDPFALTIKAIMLIAAGLVVLTADVYIRNHTQRQGEFYALLLLAILTICLLSGTTDLVMLFVTFEFLNILSYILTGYLWEDKRSTEAAIKYFLYGTVLSAVMLYGMSWFYGLTGATDLHGIARALTGQESALRPVVLPALILTVAGLAFKIGGVPFHQWAPDTYEGAPTPVAAFLSVGPQIGGFAIILRVLLTVLPFGTSTTELAIDWATLLITISVLTMTLGNLVALWQENIKRLLAYSSIAQAGYVLVGVVATSPLGVAAVLFYLIAYALANLGIFAAIIAFSNQTGSDQIEDYAGLHRRAPGLAMIMIICLLSLTGLPPTGGFFAKLWLFSAAYDAGLLWLAVLGVVNSVISLSCYWKIIHAMYLLPAETEERLSTSPMLAVALGVTVVGVLVVGIFSGPLLSLLQTAAPTFFGG